jgi:flagellar assembly protein FliH
MSAMPARFTFDLNLADNPERTSFIDEAAHAAMLQQSRADGYAEGFTAGERSAASASAAALATAATILADQAGKMLGEIDAARRSAEAEAVGLAAAIARKLASSLVAAQPAAELAALLTDCLGSLEGVPHLVVRCHPDLADAMREIAAARVAASGFAGRLIVMGEPEIAPGDGRLEWADGGLVRDLATVQAEIDQRIDDYLAARAAPHHREAV